MAEQFCICVAAPFDVSGVTMIWNDLGGLGWGVGAPGAWEVWVPNSVIHLYDDNDDDDDDDDYGEYDDDNDEYDDDDDDV